MEKAPKENKKSNNNFISTLKKGFTLNRILIIIIFIGILFRIFTYWTLTPSYDGNAYIAVGHSIAKTGKVMAPWGGDFGSGNTSNLEYTRISPVFPSYLAIFYYIFGYSIEITQIAGIILAIITLSIIYLTTKNLFDYQKGLIVTAIMSMTWPFIFYPGMEWGDNMVLLFFTLTLWSLLKGLKDSRFMVLFGLFGAVLFLTKIHSIHFIFILGLVAGFFLWRYYFSGSNIFKDKYYYIGGSIFLIITLGWQIRNYIRFSGTSQGSSFGYTQASISPELFIMFILKFPYLLILVALCFLFWTAELKAALSKIKIEDYNPLWVFTIGFFMMIWVITSLMAGTRIQDMDIVFRLNHDRYIAPVYISILWLVVKDQNWLHKGKTINYFGNEMIHEIKKWFLGLFRDKKNLLFITIITIIGIVACLFIEFFIGLVLIFAAPTLAIKSARKRLVIMLLAFSIASANTATYGKEYPYKDAGEDLQELLNEGDIVMVDGEWFIPEKYNLYPYLTEYDIKVMEYDENINASYIFSYINRNYTGYTLVGGYYLDIDLGIIIKIRDKFLGIFISRYSEEESSSQEIPPSCWLWTRD